MKKPVVIIVGAIVLGMIGAGTYLLTRPASFSPSTIVDSISSTPTQIPAKLIFWKDPAGFTFSYPEGVVIDKHDEDKVNYAHIEMTHPQHPGSLIFWAKDLPTGVTDTDTWVKKDKILSSGSSLDTSLGTIAAKKVMIAQPEKRVVVGTVADGLLFYMETVLSDEAYWLQVSDAISSSFAITTQAEPASEGGIPADDVAADEEEVLE